MKLEREDWVGVVAISVMVIFMISVLILVVEALQPGAEEERRYRQCQVEAVTLADELACRVSFGR